MLLMGAAGLSDGRGEPCCQLRRKDLVTKAGVPVTQLFGTSGCGLAPGEQPDIYIGGSEGA